MHDVSPSPPVIQKHLPKRTNSFNSFSQLSTNSLPDIKEYREGKKVVNISSCNTVDRVVERPRSKSHQHNFPPTLGIRPNNKEASSLPKCKTKTSKHQDDLLASLEMMNSLAADLPAPESSFKRSYTLIPMKAKRNASPRDVILKPPLPKLTHILSSQNGYDDTFQSKTPTPIRKKSYPTRSNHPTDLPCDIFTSYDPSCGMTRSANTTPSEKSHLFILEDFKKLTNNPISVNNQKVFVSETALQVSNDGGDASTSQFDPPITGNEADPDTISLNSNKSHSPLRDSKDMLSSSDFLNSVTASSPILIRNATTKVTGTTLPSNKCANQDFDLSLDSGMMSTPSPPLEEDNRLLCLDSDYKDNGPITCDKIQPGDNVEEIAEDSASLLSCSLSEKSDTSGSKYDNVCISSTDSQPTDSCKHESTKPNVNVINSTSDNSLAPLDTEPKCVDGESSFTNRDSTAGCGADFFFNKGAGLMSLRRILSSGKTSNV